MADLIGHLGSPVKPGMTTVSKAGDDKIRRPHLITRQGRFFCHVERRPERPEPRHLLKSARTQERSSVRISTAELAVKNHRLLATTLL